MKIVVDGAGFKELNQEYVATSADEIPTGIFPSNNFFMIILYPGFECFFLIFFLFSIQVLNGFVGKKVGMLQTHGGS